MTSIPRGSNFCTREDTNSMSLLALELGSLHPEIPIPIIKQTLKHIESKLYIVIFFTPDFASQLNTPAKRAGQFKQLQDLVSGLYVCTAAETELPCTVVFADWCGYSVREETWEYNVLFIPECSNPPSEAGVDGSDAGDGSEITKVKVLCEDSHVSR
jgi:hypothetical protein